MDNDAFNETHFELSRVIKKKYQKRLTSLYAKNVLRQYWIKTVIKLEHGKL